MVLVETLAAVAIQDPVYNMAYIRQTRDAVVAATVSKNENTPALHRPHPLSECVPRPQSSMFECDGPGEQALSGPRHDNDKVYIKEISLLPTADECFSLRSPWMPSKNVDSRHFMPHGYTRHIDVHFRLLRHDSVEKIRDINYNATQQAFLTAATVNGPCGEDFLETAIGNRYFLYRNVKVEDLMASEHDGVVLRMSFDCPIQLRGRQMHKSTRLAKGMLCAILLLNHQTNEFSIQYFNIGMRHSTYSLATKNGHQERAAVELCILPDATKQDTRNALSIATGAQANVSMALVEYPKLLYAGFANVLHCLQHMTDHDYAFGQYISPGPEVFENDEIELQVRPPSYAEQPDFTFDLSPLTGKSASRFPLGHLADEKRQHTLKHLEQCTSLDHGQAVALLASLTRELSFTQGPPGCGKTFLGIALTRVLLASRPIGSEKPILVVCRTNHALDSFLAGLRDADVNRLLRVGNGSKTEWTKAINLRAVSKENNYSPREMSKRFHINEKKDQTWAILDTWCRDLSKEWITGLPCWQLVYPILREQYPKMCSQLLTHTAKPAAFAFTYDYWARGGDIATIELLHQELMARLSANLKDGEQSDLSEDFVKSFLADIAAYTKNQSTSAGKDDIWHLTLVQRTRLMDEWQTKIDKQCTVSKLQSIHEEHQELLKSTRTIRDDRYVRTMLKQNVVGMTTTACASRWELLRAVGFEVMICEEAAEVLEAHNLCTLLPSLKHAIHIGDPQQLRPNVEEQGLALENPRGMAYRLDESLFERIMKPFDCRAKIIPTSKLHIQRRMHPEIANVSRVTYPFLQDHESTSLNPRPKGLQRRLWWIDHEVPEDATKGVSKSVTNEYEVGVVKELVAYLLRGNDYNFGDIAILTPYSGQLLKLREALSTEFAVWLSDHDREALVEAGAIDADSDDLDDQKKLSVAMKDYIRLATIDNFQGEEAKILILSTVRSGGRLGFVKSPNRINVACSRARDGFYIVGNASTLETDPKWQSILNVFRSQQRVGKYIHLQCDRHTEHQKLARSADDIKSFTACTKRCEKELPCGHVCIETCHDPTLHNVIPCRQACKKTLECGHECPNTCTEPCGPCLSQTSRYLSSCGHTALIPCSGEKIECDHFEGYYNLPCGKHTVRYTCGEPAKSKICGEICGEELSCGHQCDRLCGKCHSEEQHPRCTQTCSKLLSCGHQCNSSCHGESECSSCEQPAEPSCCHELATERRCTERPEPCLMTVSATGPHGKTHDVICSLTKSTSGPGTMAEMLTPTETEPLIHSIITTFLRRKDSLNRSLDQREKILSRTLKLFLMQQIQTSTTAVNNTITAILHRTDETTTLQTKIVNEEHLLNTFNNTLQILSTYYPGQTITSLNGLLKSQHHSLELRATLMKARDTLAIVSHLGGCEDQSRQMQRMAGELSLFTKMELARLCEKVKEDILVEDLVGECRCLLRDVALKEGEEHVE